jgi:quinol monooxygenase YgiN
MLFLEQNLPNVRSFDGCVSVNVYFSLDGREMLLEEEWLSVEHHQRYIGFISKNGVMQLLRGLLMADPTINYFEKAPC